MSELVAHDAANMEWTISACRMQLREAALQEAGGSLGEASRLTVAVREKLEKVVAFVPTNRNARVQLTAAWRMAAELAVDAPDAARAIARAVELGEDLVRAGAASDAALAECARAGLVAARLAAEAGDRASSQQRARRALHVLSPRWEDSNDWRLLDPAMRALAFLGREPESHAVAARLRRLGYQPLSPWPTLGSISDRPAPPKK
jgi:hypothetical protein